MCLQIGLFPLGSHGRPRMTQELKEIGLAVGRRHVGRSMRNNGIHVVRTHKCKANTDSDNRFNIATDWLDRNFHNNGPNHKRAGDISFIWTRVGWMYLAVVIDLHSRRAIGCAVCTRFKNGLASLAMPLPLETRHWYEHFSANAVVETIFKTLKAELIWRHSEPDA